jgi:endoglucanase
VRPDLAGLIMANRPLAYWPLQDTLADVAHDRVGGHDGTVAGDVHVAQIGQGTTMTSDSFDGASSRITAPAAGLVPGAVAASAWFRTPRHSGRYGDLVETGGISLLVGGGHAVAVTCTAGRACRALSSTTTVNDGAWHQVALSVDHGIATMYVDGQRSSTAPSAGVDAPAETVDIGAGFAGSMNNVALFAHPVSTEEVATEFGAGACPQAAGTSSPPATAAVSLPALPLHTSGRWIVDALGKRVKLAGVNWYGAEELDGVPAGLQCQSADAIAAHIAASGFNVVRLPWATDDWVGAPRPVPPIAVAADPALRGLDARAAFDAVIAALGRHGLMVVLDNHVGRPDWCCAGNDGNALWWTSYDPAHPPRWSTRTWWGKLRLFRWGQSRWIGAWRAVTARYAPGGPHPQPNVIGADLRNEPRTDSTLHLTATWRSGHVAPWVNWPRAAQRAGDAVLARNRNLLVVVEGTSYGTDLRGVHAARVRLAVGHRLVYSAHDYGWYHVSADRVATDLGSRWGWLLTQGRPWTSPVWVGEFGTCHPEDPACAPDLWFAAFRRYLAAGDVDWAYWSMAGTGARGAAEPTTCRWTLRLPGCGEGYGLSDPTWAGDGSPALTADLRAVEAATQTP